MGAPFHRTALASAVLAGLVSFEADAGFPATIELSSLDGSTGFALNGVTTA